MRSHLTRNVYRRLLAGHGLLRPCVAAHSGRRCFSQYRPRVSSPSQLLAPPPRRSFFGVFEKAPRQLKEPEVEPGYETLLAFRNMETQNARPPPRTELIKGLRLFLGQKKRSLKPINPTQAFLMNRMLLHLFAATPEDESMADNLSLNDLRMALELVARVPKGDTSEHLQLAKRLYEEIEWRAEATPEAGEDKTQSDFVNLLKSLTQYGGSLEAIERLEAGLKGEASGSKLAKKLWTMVLRGLAKEGQEEKLVSQFQKADEAEKLGYSSAVHEIMTTFFATRNRVEETKHWFEKPIPYKAQTPTDDIYMEITRFAVRNGQQKWTQPIFEQLMAANPSKSQRDIILYWSVLAMDKGVEDVKQLMVEMKNGQGQEPDAATIDILIMAAIEKRNPYLAERFLSVGAELGIAPKGSTYVLQMDYRLDANDLSGALAIYPKLHNREVEVNNDEDLPVLNKYLRKLCTAKEPDAGLILDITSDLEQRRATLEPETVVALCMLFLHGDQQFDVIDTLSLHTVTYSLEERKKVREAFVEYCIDPKVSTARVWDGYSLLRQFFPETEPEHRIRLMDAFFERRRPDMACHIFGHMRAHSNPKQHPTDAVYVRCLEGIGRHPDGESLRMVHNMLKMDATVQMNTRVWNALMLAYASCGAPAAALAFWREITNSAEGPTYNSLAILFWVCELVGQRESPARAVWQKIQRMDLDVPQNVFWSYCGTVAAQGFLDEVKRLIQGSEASFGYSPNIMTLGITYNALPSQTRKDMFEEWARDEYPDLWARLEAKGRRHKLGAMPFNIDRNMMA